MSFLALIKAQFQQKARCKENERFLCTLIQGNPKDLIAICSQDGIPPERQDWANAAPILCVPALPSGEIANTEGVSHFTLVWDEKHISVEFDDWDLMTVQRFTPICNRIPGGYNTVAICWCVSEQAAVAA